VSVWKEARMGKEGAAVGDGHAVLQNAYAARELLGTIGDTERA